MKKELCSIKHRVLIINGSPHTNGPTSQLMDSFIKALPASAAVIRFDCYARAPLPCNDCGACHQQNGCALTDLDDFYTLLEDSDALVFATPIYNLSFPAPLKALIDRTQRYWAARFIRGIRPPIAKSKRVILLTAAGTDDSDSGMMLERQLRPVLTILNAKLIQTVHYTGADCDHSPDASLKAAASAAVNLFGPKGC